MSRDLRNEFIDQVKLSMMDRNDSDLIVSRVAVILERYELSERVTDLVPAEDENMEMIKLYASALVIDGKAKSTIAQYVRELKCFSSVIGKKDLKTVGAFDVRNYLAKKKMGGVSNRTLENARAIISAFFGWMAAEEIIQKNPCVTIKPVKYQDEIRHPFSVVELDRLRGSCRTIKERCMIEFLLATGVRVAEFCDLDISDVDLISGRIRIRNGKGGKERYTYMNDLAKEHLVKYLDGRDIGPLFLTRSGKRYEPGGVRFVLRTLGKKAGIDDVHPHRFRRTFATTLAARGMQQQEIQKLMGHSNINTTMIYVTLSEMEMQMAYKKFA